MGYNFKNTLFQNWIDGKQRYDLYEVFANPSAYPFFNSFYLSNYYSDSSSLALVRCQSSGSSNWLAPDWAYYNSVPNLYNRSNYLPSGLYAGTIPYFTSNSLIFYYSQSYSHPSGTNEFYTSSFSMYRTYSQLLFDFGNGNKYSIPQSSFTQGVVPFNYLVALQAAGGKGGIGSYGASGDWRFTLGGAGAGGGAGALCIVDFKHYQNQYWSLAYTFSLGETMHLSCENEYGERYDIIVRKGGDAGNASVNPYNRTLTMGSVGLGGTYSYYNDGSYLHSDFTFYNSIIYPSGYANYLSSDYKNDYIYPLVMLNGSKGGMGGSVAGGTHPGGADGGDGISTNNIYLVNSKIYSYTYSPLFCFSIDQSGGGTVNDGGGGGGASPLNSIHSGGYGGSGAYSTGNGYSGSKGFIKIYY